MKTSLLALLAVGLVALPATLAEAGDGVGSLKLMPKDTNIAFNLNIKRLRSGKAYDEIIDQARMNGDFKETEAALKKAGVNLKKDVDTITLGVRADGKGEPAGLVVIGKGRFKQGKIVAAMKAENADLKKKRHKGVTYYVFGKDGAFAFVGKDMVMAEGDQIKGVIDRYKSKGRKSAAKSKLMKGMLSRTDTKKDLWFVAEVKKNSAAGVPMADKLRSVVGSFDMVGGLGIRVRVRFSDAKTPKELVDQFTAFRPMAAEMPEIKKMGLDTVVNKAVLVADEKDVVFKVDLTPDEAAKLRGLAESMGGAM